MCLCATDRKYPLQVQNDVKTWRDTGICWINYNILHCLVLLNKYCPLYCYVFHPFVYIYNIYSIWYPGNAPSVFFLVYCFASLKQKEMICYHVHYRCRNKGFISHFESYGSTDAATACKATKLYQFKCPLLNTERFHCQYLHHKPPKNILILGIVNKPIITSSLYIRFWLFGYQPCKVRKPKSL